MGIRDFIGGVFMMRNAVKRGWRLARALATALGLAVMSMLAACDPDRVARLEEGVATEDDVRRQFGTPEAEYAEADGSRTLEYPRQPEGRTNYMITIGPDGKMSALRQVLKPADFAKVKPGMGKADVRRVLGRPARMQPFALKQQEDWDWYWLDGTIKKMHTVTFDAAGRVLGSASADDPREVGGGR